MVAHTHTTYACDRCKADLGTERPDRSQASDVQASFGYKEGPGPSFVWSDLCDSCDAQVKAFFNATPFRQIHPSEKREARVWWNEVNAWVNKEMAEYVMYRAKLLLGDWRPGR